MSASILEPVPVTQDDRDAAADLHTLIYGGAAPLGAERMREGLLDRSAFVQAFARHAQRALSTRLSNNMGGV